MNEAKDYTLATADHGGIEQEEKDEPALRCARLVAAGETSLGEAIRQCFPEAVTGDETPEQHDRLIAALTAYVLQWAERNVPERK